MVYFVCRSEYEAPHGRRIREFPDAANLTDWFRAHWVTREDHIYDLLAQAFGGGIYGLSELFTPMLDRSPPESLADVENFVASFKGSYSEGTIAMIDGAIRADTNDDEIEIAWYLFDDSFVSRFPERISFLLNRQLELPEESNSEGWIPSIATKTIADGDETTFCCFFSGQDGLTITDIEGCYRVAARLPDLGNWLCSQSINASPSKYGGVETGWPPDLILLRALALLSNDHSFEAALRSFDALNREFSGWLPRTFSDYEYKAKKPQFLTTEPTIIEEQLRALRKATLNSGKKVATSYWVSSFGETYFQFAPNMCQVVFSNILTARDDPSNASKFFRHWIFFDDLWASAHQPLAESILRYGRGYNVLGA
jgi:hypothetical protein